MATPQVQSEPELDPPQESVTIMDPVHGSIQLDKYLFKIIDLPEFQRLRKIKQFGGVYYVYPGGVHTRFEHSIGVCYIAGQLVDALNKHSPPKEENLSKWFTPQEKMCVQIAALCHNIGHGPFSHVYDFAVKEYYERLEEDQEKKIKFITLNEDDDAYQENEQNLEKKSLPKKAKHKYRSALIVERIMSKLEFKELEKEKDSYIQLIRDMIAFSELDMNNDHEETMATFWQKQVPCSDCTPKKSYRQKSYLFEIVANGFTGIDVDKMDYFARDAHSVGLPNSFDWRRFTQTAKIICIKDERNEEFHHICSRDKDALSLYEMFHTRTLLYRSVYRHKTVIIVEGLMKKALWKANHVIHVNGYPLLECWKNIDAFLTLNDTIEDYILQLCDEKLSPPLPPPNAPTAELFDAKKLFNRITERQLPKFVGRTIKNGDGDDHKKSACKAVHDNGLEINEAYLESKEATFAFGKRGEDPIMSHYFYNKEKPGVTPEPYKFKKEEVSSLLPYQLDETQLLWYYDVTEHDKNCTSNNEAKTGSAIVEILSQYFTSVAN